MPLQGWMRAVGCCSKIIMASLIQEGVTLGIAITGAALGILNTWRAFDRDRVRLRVTPVWVFYESGAEGIAIEVTNLSFFPITITHLGFIVHGGKEHMPLLNSDIKGCQLPERMEARTCFTARLPIGAAKDPNFKRVRCAYADTACGRKFTGTSKALRQYLKRIHSR